MATQSGVFVLQQDETLVPLQAAHFSAELDFQALLTRFPALLAGDQIDPVDPRRFVLVRQEQSIGLEAAETRWSVDHLFVDQDGIPTLVEVKRQSDTRVRREVVGQMLDYASNCQACWTAESIRAGFEATCLAAGSPSESVLSDLIGSERSAESFWADVQTNLQAGKIRMLIVADQVPVELRRIVEFLNKQLISAEILAVELRQFTGQGLRTIVPMVFGGTQEAAQKRTSSAPGVRWTAERFQQTIDAKFAAPEAAVAHAILTWMKGCGYPLVFGTGRENGSVYPLLRPKGVSINPVYLSTEGKIWLQFAPLLGKPVFGEANRRAEMLERFACVTSSNLSGSEIDGYAKLTFATVAADRNGMEKILAAWTWVIEQVKLFGSV